jgi:hypothetical protein
MEVYCCMKRWWWAPATVASKGNKMRTFPWSRKRGSTGASSPTLPIADYLRKVDIFQDLSREEIEDLFQGTVLKECIPGTVFFTPKDSSERVFILKYLISGRTLELS